MSLVLVIIFFPLLFNNFLRFEYTQKVSACQNKKEQKSQAEHETYNLLYQIKIITTLLERLKHL